MLKEILKTLAGSIILLVAIVAVYFIGVFLSLTAVKLTIIVVFFITVFLGLGRLLYEVIFDS